MSATASDVTLVTLACILCMFFSSLLSSSLLNYCATTLDTHTSAVDLHRASCVSVSVSVCVYV